MPPGRFLTSVRIEAAKLLLAEREYSLEMIAGLCGFSGANYLCRVFKRETGLSPAAWRETAAHKAVVQKAARPQQRNLCVKAVHFVTLYKEETFVYPETTYFPIETVGAMLHNKKTLPPVRLYSPTFSRFALTQPFPSYILKDTALLPPTGLPGCIPARKRRRCRDFRQSTSTVITSKNAPVLLLGLLALLMVDYIQLLIPQFYRLVINGVNLGQVVVNGQTLPFTKEVLLQPSACP